MTLSYEISACVKGTCTTLPILVWVQTSIDYWKAWFLTLCSREWAQETSSKSLLKKICHVDHAPLGCRYPVALNVYTRSDIEFSTCTLHSASCANYVVFTSQFLILVNQISKLARRESSHYKRSSRLLKETEIKVYHSWKKKYSLKKKRYIHSKNSLRTRIKKY